jgi:hypothetical protein
MDEESKKASISPNPFSTLATLTFSTEQHNTIIFITDVLGREMARSNFSGTRFVVERGEMTSGIYFVTTLGTKGERWSQKIVVE